MADPQLDGDRLWGGVSTAVVLSMVSLVAGMQAVVDIGNWWGICYGVSALVAALAAGVCWADALQQPDNESEVESDEM